MLFICLLTLVSAGNCNSECIDLVFDDVCDKKCNNKYCFYDNYVCNDCSVGCLYSMVGDGECDLACYVKECNYDLFDCIGICNDQCEPSFIGNGICDYECFTEQCAYDNGDCDGECAINCKWSDINNGFCNYECMNKECLYDGDDCRYDIWVEENANGIGSEDSPLSSFSDAFLDIYYGVYYIHLAPGVYFINEIIEIDCICSLIITGSNSEIRFTSPQSGLKIFYASSVEISGLIFDGSELWEPSCSSDYCRFIYQFICYETYCENALGMQFDLYSTYVQDFESNYLENKPLILISLFSVPYSKIWNIELRNFDYVNNLIESRDGSIEVQNIIVNNTSMYSGLVSVISEVYSENIANYFYADLILSMEMSLNNYYAKVENIVLEEINTMRFPQRDSKCLYAQVPGVLNTVGISQIYVNNITLLFVHNSNKITSFDGAITISGYSNFTIKNIYAKNVLLQSGALISIQLDPIFLMLFHQSTLIENILIEESYFSTPAILIRYNILTSDVLFQNISIKNSSFYYQALKFISKSTVLKEIFLQNIDEEKNKVNFKMNDIIIKGFIAENLKLNDHFISKTLGGGMVLTDLEFYNINYLSEEYYIDKALKRYSDSFSFFFPDQQVANIMFFNRSMNIDVSLVKCNDIVLDGSIVSIYIPYNIHKMSEVYINSSYLQSGFYIQNNTNSSILITTTTLTNSKFIISGITTETNFNIEIHNLTIENLFSSAINSSSMTTIITNSIFQNSFTQNSLVILNPTTINNKASISNCLFYNNTGVPGVDLSFSAWLGSEFIIEIYTTTFKESYGQSPISILSYPNTHINYILFSKIIFEGIQSNNCNLYSDKGAINFELAKGTVIFEDSIFRYNSKTLQSHTAPIFYHNNYISQPIIFKNCTMTRNLNDVFIIQNSLIIIQKSEYSNIVYSENQSKFISGENIQFSIQNSIFYNNQHIGSLFELKEKSMGQILNTSFYNNKPLGTGSIIMCILAEKLIIESTIFIENYYIGSFLIFLQFSAVEFQDLKFENNEAYSAVSGIIINLNASDIEVYDDRTVNFFDIKESWADIRGLKMDKGKSAFQFTDSYVNLQEISLKNIQFRVLIGFRVYMNISQILIEDTSGTISLENCTLSANEVRLYNLLTLFQILNSVFSLNKSSIISSTGTKIVNSEGSITDFLSINTPTALTILESRISIFTSMISYSNNSGIYIENSYVIIKNSEFKDNIGNLGGGIYADFSTVIINNTVFSNNSAIEGGGFYIKNTSMIENNNNFINNTAIHGNDKATPALFIDPDNDNIYNVTSGMPTTNLSFYLKDQYGQIMYSDNTSVVEMTPNSSSVIVGEGKFISSLGKFEINVNFLAQPGSNGTFILQSEAPEKLVVDFFLSFRKCVVGELTFQDSSCKPCDNNTYSININDKYCKPCPNEAVCYGMNNIYPAAGYWTELKYPDRFYECPNKGACIQGTGTENNCAFSYTGRLCGECIKGYKRNGSYMCRKCPEYWASWAIITISSIMILLLIAFLVYSNIKNLNKQKSELALLLKILVNYCQTIMLFAHIDLKWPESTLNLLDFSQILGDSSKEVFSLSCSTETSSISSSITDTAITAFFPFVLCACAFIVWISVSLRKKSLKYIRTHFVSTCIVVFLLMHASVYNSLMSLMSCKSVNDKYWSTNDFSLQCYEGKHIQALIYIGIPGLTVWCLFLPLMIFYSLYKKRNALDQNEVKVKFKTLFDGYTPGFYYWEFLIILRKFSIRLITILLLSAGITVQGLGILIILLLALVTHMKFQPYEKQSINKLEFYCIILLNLSIIFGILFTTDINQIIKETLSWVLFCLHLSFLVYWAKFFFIAFGEILKKNSFYLKIMAKFSLKEKGKVGIVVGEDATPENDPRGSSLEIVNAFDANKSADFLLPSNPNNSCVDNLERGLRVNAWKRI
ncbi:hypothetical protein SteCoe_31873 [Stentor coeruleus]|uniref:LNR domain-containing protein n=1 Tax=Stentor coeruleus TaxID=5963 RepID=A0A1R2B0C8_9CILI|nr:hypothetical protein SteCoe_31873 [Stentor coeruleus]